MRPSPSPAAFGVATSGFSTTGTIAGAVDMPKAWLLIMVPPVEGERVALKNAWCSGWDAAPTPMMVGRAAVVLWRRPLKQSGPIRGCLIAWAADNVGVT